MLLTNDTLGLLRARLQTKMQSAARAPVSVLSRATSPTTTGSPERVSLSFEATAASAQSILETSMEDKVREMFEAYGIEEADVAGLDFSPEATAQRIFDFSTGLMEIYRDQNPELDEEAFIDSFESTIRGAVDSGYGEAIAILEGMQMSADVLSTAEETKTVLDGLFDDFFSELREDAEPGG